MLDLLSKTWWTYHAGDGWFTHLYSWANVTEGCLWLLFACLVLRRYLKHRRSTIELLYAFAFLTFGLSEIWYDEPTGEVFWRAVPIKRFDPSRHKFRVATFAETLDRMRRTHALIRKYRPQAKIVFTLSPVGLAATFRPVACVTANAVSKALLRTAIDQLYREVHESDPDFFYFPSYEVVTAGFNQPYGSDLRHPAVHVLNCNMKAFERYFCTTGLTDGDVEAVMADALKLDVLLKDASPGERRLLVEPEVAAWQTKKGAEVVARDVLGRRGLPQWKRTGLSRWFAAARRATQGWFGRA